MSEMPSVPPRGCGDPAARVAIVATGVANLASVRAALARCGVQAVVTRDATDINQAAAVVLPGVGSFAAGMSALDSLRLAEPLRERVRAGRATLAICLGMQMLFDSSDESPGVVGLGAAKGRVGRFTGGNTALGPIRVPQLGWNRIAPEQGMLVTPGCAYYANSFRVVDHPDSAAAPVAAGWRCAWTTHGERFLAAMQRDAVLACQFHPELSGRWGLNLIGRWLDLAFPARPRGAPARPSDQAETARSSTGDNQC